MKKKIVYTDEDIQIGEIVPDFLPSPEEIAKAGQIEKITISLSEESLEFFRTQANTFKTSYQKMIRKILDEYVSQYKRKNPSIK
jgi:hypothetical protein